MRPGRTKTTSFSLDSDTLKNLKALAARRHKGNVSALLAEVAAREAKFAGAEAYFEKYAYVEWWRGRTDIREETLAAVVVEDMPPRLCRAAGEALAAVSWPVRNISAIGQSRRTASPGVALR